MRRRVRGRRVAGAVCRAGSLLSATAFVVLGFAALTASSAAAAPAAGTAEVVTPQDGTSSAGKTLANGSGKTRFSLKLPAGAACSGDSTNGGYRVQSFMVPRGVDPASLTFGATGPLPLGRGAAFRQPLFAVNTTAFVNAATNLADKPGGPGVIINVPSFDFGVLSTDDLPRGIYAIGIACTKGPPSPTQLDRFWSARLDLGGGEADAHSWAAPVGDATPSSGATNAPGAPAGHASSPATEQGPPAEALGADGVGSAKDAGGGGAESPTIANARVDGDTPAAPNFGGPPTFTLPATEIASHLTVDGNMAASLLLWLALAVAFGRIAVLLARISTTTAVVMP